MDTPDTDFAATLDPHSPPESSAGSIHEVLKQSPPSPSISKESPASFAGWRTIGEQQDFYDEQDCLDPSHSLTCDKLGGRTEDDVVIFDYSLDPEYLSQASGNPSVEEGGPSSRFFEADNDIFFRVPKNGLLESKQFDQIINPTEEPRLMLSRGSRLGIM